MDRMGRPQKVDPDMVEVLTRIRRLEYAVNGLLFSVFCLSVGLVVALCWMRR